MEAWATAILAVVALIGLVSGAIAWSARKDSQLASKDIEGVNKDVGAVRAENTAKMESIRSEIRADMAAMELRLTNLLRGDNVGERLARIEERMSGMENSLREHAANVNIQLSTLQKIRQGCEDCILKDRRANG